MSSFTEPLEYEFTGSLYHGRPLYITTKDFSYRFGSVKEPVSVFLVPAGFKTDLASIPWPFKLFFPPDGPWAKAAVLHDFLCVNLGVSNIAKDAIFYEALKVLNINPVIAFCFFMSVRIYHDFFSPDRKSEAWKN